MNNTKPSDLCRCPTCGENNSVSVVYEPEYLAKCEHCGASWTDMTTHVVDIIYHALGATPAE